MVQEDRADDLLQETLLVALQHQGRPVRSTRPWLARVAFNLARRLSAVRFPGRWHPSLPDVLPSSDRVPPLDNAAGGTGTG